MKGFRIIYRCPKCKRMAKKVEGLTNTPANMFCGETSRKLCKYCGEVVDIELVIAKRKLFGLFGWNVKEQK